MGFFVAFILPLAVMFGIMYLFIFMPQKKQQKQHNELINNLKAGDKVITSSGIIGQIVSVDGQSIVITSQDSKLEMSKIHVIEVL